MNMMLGLTTAMHHELTIIALNKDQNVSNQLFSFLYKEQANFGTDSLSLPARFS